MISNIELARETMLSLCDTQREEREDVIKCFHSISEADRFQKQEREVLLLRIKWTLTEEQYKAFHTVFC